MGLESDTTLIDCIVDTFKKNTYTQIRQLADIICKVKGFWYKSVTKHALLS